MKKLSPVRYLIIIQLLLLSSFVQPAKAQSALQRFDDRVMINLSEHRTPAATGWMKFISNSNHYVNVGVPVGLLAGGIIADDKAMRQNALYIASSTAITSGLTALIKHLVKRPRPFVQNINITPVYRASGYSFPSGHSSSAFSTATSLSAAYPKWYVIVPSYAWAGATAYSRMYLGVHYPSDVTAGALLGAGTGVSLLFLRK